MPQDKDIATLGRSIGRTHKFIHAWVDRHLAPLGGSVTEFILLFHIDSAAEPGLSQTEIARFSDIGGPALVRHMDRLERDGIVQRSRDTTDRRIMRVQLTGDGKARLADLEAVIRSCDERMRSLLTKQEAAVMQGALDKLFDFALAELFGPVDIPPILPPTRSLR